MNHRPTPPALLPSVKGPRTALPLRAAPIRGAAAVRVAVSAKSLLRTSNTNPIIQYLSVVRMNKNNLFPALMNTTHPPFQPGTGKLLTRMTPPLLTGKATFRISLLIDA